MGIFRCSRNGLACTTANRLGTVMGTGQAIGAHIGAGGQFEDAKKQALVLTGRHEYYTRVQEAGVLSGRKSERGCLCNARLGGQNS